MLMPWSREARYKNAALRSASYCPLALLSYKLQHSLGRELV